MKISLLWNDSTHIGPLLRSLPNMADLGVTVVHRSITRAPNRLQDSCDAVLIHQELMSDAVLAWGKPIVILERIDGSQLGASRKWINHKQVAGVIKGYCLRPATLNNESAGRHHVRLMSEFGIKSPKPMARFEPSSIQVESAKLARIKPGYGFGAYRCMDSFVREPFNIDADRPKDTHFLGTITYSGSEIETHRKAALRAVEQWEASNPGKTFAGGGRPLRKGPYVQSLLSTKTAVSAYGWGEAAYRDYEAIYLGAVLVRPSMSHVACWPDVFIPNETFIECKPDFSDLAEIVARVKRDWPAYRKMRQKARSIAVEGWRQQNIAARMVALLKELLA